MISDIREQQRSSADAALQLDLPWGTIQAALSQAQVKRMRMHVNSSCLLMLAHNPMCTDYTTKRPNAQVRNTKSITSDPAICTLTRYPARGVLWLPVVAASGGVCKARSG